MRHDKNRRCRIVLTLWFSLDNPSDAEALERLLRVPRGYRAGFVKRLLLGLDSNNSSFLPEETLARIDDALTALGSLWDDDSTP